MLEIKNFFKDNMLPDGFSIKENKIVCDIDKSLMELIPEGIFIMGSEDNFSSKPIHELYLDSYLIDSCQVTNKQFKKFMESGGYTNKEFWSEDSWKIKEEEGWKQPRYWEDSPWNNPSHPVIAISWYEAEAYATWAGKVLPTEAQWEKAARGGFWLDGDLKKSIKNPFPKRKYPWGNEEPDEGNIKAIFKKEEKFGGRYPGAVGLFEAGKSPYGCYDMAGNVWEWCRDWYKINYYKTSPKSNPLGPEDGEYKVLRGGSWARDPKFLTVSFRTKSDPSTGGWDLSGFRTVKKI